MSKISVIGALVPALIDAREKLVIACQFQRTLDLLEVRVIRFEPLVSPRASLLIHYYFIILFIHYDPDDLRQSTLTALGCGCLRIDGRVSAASRQQLVDRFVRHHAVIT